LPPVSLPSRPHNDVYLETDQVRRKREIPIQISFISSLFNDNVFSLDLAKVEQTLPE
jgi:hypothetical protein